MCEHRSSGSSIRNGKEARFNHILISGPNSRQTASHNNPKPIEERMPHMLVLSRKASEKIVFPGFNITVQVLDIQGGKVRLGIEAPPDVQIMRKELLERSQQREMDDHAVEVLTRCS